METGETPRVSVVDEYTVDIRDETHTLMGLLKWVISSNWNGHKVEFCGYNVPHPSDNLVRLSVQLEGEEQRPSDVLEKMMSGLESIERCCETLSDKFDEALAKAQINL